MKKCVLAAKDCVYMGYKIGRGGVRPEDSKIQAIVEMSRPRAKKDVRIFVGMTRYYRRFVQDYAIRHKTCIIHVSDMHMR